MKRWTMPAVLLLAACSGGEEEQAPPSAAEDSTAAPQPPAVPEAPPAPDAPTAENADDGAAIPAAIQGRWGLVAADCTSTRGDAKGLLTIDAASLRFYESHGRLVRVHERSAGRLAADYAFSGEGMEWQRRVQLDVEEGGKTLVRRDTGEGASPEPLRYTRCAA